MHHSPLRDGDGIIFGARRLDELESNVMGARNGPLSERMVEAIERAWKQVKDGGVA
jgi:hypothetical protein